MPMNSPVPPADERAPRPGGAGLRRVTCEPLSVTLIGAGRRGLGVHVPALAASTELRLAAIVETPERMAVLQKTPGSGHILGATNNIQHEPAVMPGLLPASPR